MIASPCLYCILSGFKVSSAKLYNLSLWQVNEGNYAQAISIFDQVKLGHYEAL